MNGKRVIAALALGVGAVALAGVGTAAATPPPVALSSSAPLLTVNADAYNASSTGGVYSAPANDASCLGFPTASSTSSLFSVPGVLTASSLSARCSVNATDNTASAISNIGRVSLLGGKVVLTNVRSQCLSDVDGDTTVESTVGGVNGLQVATGPVKIVIPDVASIYLDENSQTYVPVEEDTGIRMQTIGAEIVIAPMTTTVLGKTHTTPGLDIIVGQCHIDGFSDAG